MKKGGYLVAAIIVLAGILTIFQLTGCSDPPLPPPFIFEPDAPDGLSATVISATEIYLEWNDLSVNEDSFEIYERVTAEGQFRFLTRVDSAVVSTTLTEKRPVTEYSYKVRAVNEGGVSAFSEIVTVTTLNTPPLPVSDLKVEGVSQVLVRISWTDNSNNEDGFRIERRSGDLEWSSLDTLAANTVTYRDEADLVPGITYFYRIISFNTGGDSEPSQELEVTVLHYRPVAPSEFRGEGIEPREIILYWVDNSDNEAGFKIDRRTDRGQPWVVLDTVAANLETYTDNLELLTDRVFYYRLTAFNSGGNSDLIADISVTTPGLPDGLTGLSVRATSSTEVMLSWTDISTDEEGFKVARRSSNADIWEPIGTVGVDATTYIDTLVETNASYSYQVNAFNRFGESVPLGPVTITTLGSPLGFAAKAISSHSIQLSWENGSAARENGYRIQKMSMSDEIWSDLADLAAGTRFYTDYQVVENFAYSYRVLAFGDRSVSDNTAEITVNTLGMPLEFYIFATSTSTIRLHWHDNSNAEDGFQVERRRSPLDFWAVRDTAESNTGAYLDTDLDQFTTYFYRIRAINSNAASDYTAGKEALTFDIISNAPSDLSAEVIGRDAINLHWVDNANNEVGFKIERKESGGVYTLLATLNRGVNMFEDTGLTAEVTYFYRVQSFNSGGNSEWSNEAEIFLRIEEITEVVPNSAMQGESLTVTIAGHGSHFSTIQDFPLVWLESRHGEIHSIGMNIVNDELMTADFTIPNNGRVGLWDLRVDQGANGILTLVNGFNIVPAE